MTTNLTEDKRKQLDSIVQQMIQNKEYIEQSFQEEKSTIEAVSDKTVLATKGYLELYTELTGKSITGAFIFGVM